MANHKRKKPKHLRAGCLFCKPHKDERAPRARKTKKDKAIQAFDPEGMLDLDDEG